MGLVKTRRIASMQKQTTYAKAAVVRQRAILLCHPPTLKLRQTDGYGGLKAGMRMKALPNVTFEKGVRSPSRKQANALASALRSTT